jgi:hypothetical protein
VVLAFLRKDNEAENWEGFQFQERSVPRRLDKAQIPALSWKKHEATSEQR